MTSAIKILIVDDNEVNQFVAMKMVQKWGMEAEIANHGEEALTKIVTQTFHLVLMDLDMPVMDGYESTRRIRLMDGAYFKSIPIIAFTASEIQDAKVKALDSGMNDLVAKPLQRDDLEATIDRYVANKNRPEFAERPLSIDFTQYTDGDEGFKQELILMMCRDIVELQNGLSKAVKTSSPEVFMKASHKAKTTIAMLNDGEFSAIVHELEELIWTRGRTNDSVIDRIDQFYRIAGELMTSLRMP